jgi:hypothetical protein
MSESDRKPGWLFGPDRKIRLLFVDPRLFSSDR